jgi:hypothetical protein
LILFLYNTLTMICMQWCDYTFVQIIQNDSHRPTSLVDCWKCCLLSLIWNCSVTLYQYSTNIFSLYFMSSAVFALSYKTLHIAKYCVILNFEFFQVYILLLKIDNSSNDCSYLQIWASKRVQLIDAFKFSTVTLYFNTWVEKHSLLWLWNFV